MNPIRIVKPVLVCAAAALTASCGGGGDATGGLTTFNIVPNEITLTGPSATACGAGPVGRVFVFGGAAPYKLFNTNPNVLVITRSSLGAPGGSFDVSAPTGACFDKLSIVVQDQVGRQTVLSISSVLGTDPAPPAAPN